MTREEYDSEEDSPQKPITELKQQYGNHNQPVIVGKKTSLAGKLLKGIGKGFKLR